MERVSTNITLVDRAREGYIKQSPVLLFFLALAHIGKFIGHIRSSGIYILVRTFILTTAKFTAAGKSKVQARSKNNVVFQALTLMNGHDFNGVPIAFHPLFVLVPVHPHPLQATLEPVQ